MFGPFRLDLFEVAFHVSLPIWRDFIPKSFLARTPLVFLVLPLHGEKSICHPPATQSVGHSLVVFRSIWALGLITKVLTH